MSTPNSQNQTPNNAVELAQFKRNTLFNFYESIKNGSAFFSADEMDIAIESLKLAQLDIKERERRQIQEREAETLKRKMEEDEKRRIEAEKRAAARAAIAHKKHVDEVTSMDLPVDFVNAYKDDYRASVHCDNVNDALLLSIDALGLVDIEFIASITGEEMKTVIEKLKGQIYQNPLHWEECFYKGWETADEYLSGNLRHKYHLAQEANEEYLGYFADNLSALENVMKPEIPIEDIYVTLGSPWVPSDIIDDFILHLVNLDRLPNGNYPNAAAPFLSKQYAVVHEDTTGLWEIPEKTRFNRANFHGKYEELNHHTWGTERMGMLNLMENIMNMKTLTINDYVGKDKKTKILNTKETVKILEKQDKMINEFKKWVWLDETRRKRLQGVYNRRYGNIKKRKFDGSFLEFPGMNPEIKLMPHQKDAVARIIFSDNVLLAHDVGAGKTFTMIAAGMELKRLGKSHKNMYVIPNNILPQWRKMFLHIYPKANLLVIDRKNFNVKKRAATLDKIVNEDYDAILIAYSCFDMLSLSKKYYMEFYQKQLASLEKAKEKFSAERKINSKQLSVMNLMAKLEEDMTDNVCETPFDELGINTLFIDEGHNYKNVSLHSNVTRVRGISSKGSKKCDAMMDKVHCIQRQNRGGRIVLATGTPITNSITDLFIIQKYLQNGELEFLGIPNFDSWVAMFGDKKTEFEIDVDTNSYRPATRFAKFRNVPELTAILSSVSDFYHVDSSMGLPDFEGYTDVVIPGTEDFKEFLKDISNRADDVRKKRVDRKTDNLLKITTDGRKAALDMRLIDMVYGLDFNSKVYKCAENVFQIYQNTRDEQLIQMVFCDTSTPKLSFNLYTELKRLLVAMGIPESKIAFIHDADSEDKKNLLFYSLRRGDKSVIIGSTFKMGLGVNVQEKLCALHHLDVPWRPADMVQREGRILRQGNNCDSVKIYRYVTKGSFDAYSWQLLEKKQRFISQILSGDVFVRDGDDVDDTVLNYAEVKALSVGNPLIKKKVEITNEIDKLRILQRDYLALKEKQESELAVLPIQIEKQKQHIKDVEEDMEYYNENKIDYDDIPYEEQKEIRELIYAATKTHINQPFEKKVLTYQGFDVVVPERMRPRIPQKRVTMEGEEPTTTSPIPFVMVRRKASYNMDIESLSGITKRLNFLLNNLAREKLRREEHLETLLNKKAALETELSKQGESYAKDIARLTNELEIIDKSLGVAA